MSATENQIRHRIIGVVCDVFKLSPDVVERGISPESVAGWNSEKHVELVISLEDHFGCMFEGEEVPELVSLEQMEEIITRHGAGGDE